MHRIVVIIFATIALSISLATLPSNAQKDDNVPAKDLMDMPVEKSTPTNVDYTGRDLVKIAQITEKAIDALPLSCRKQLKDCGVKIKFAAHVSQGLPKEKWDGNEETALNKFQAMYFTTAKTVVVASHSKPDSKGSSDKKTDANEISRRVRHELAHALDTCRGKCGGQYSRSKEFLDAYNKDVAAFPGKMTEEEQNLAAITTAARDGKEEAFADAFAAAHSTSADAAKDQAHYKRMEKLFPNLMALVRKRYLKECICTIPEEKITDGPVGGGQKKVRKKIRGRKKITECVNSEHVSIQLIGDGTATSHCELILTNPQTGHITSAPLQTMCVSPKTLKPPAPAAVAQANGITYHIVSPANPALVKLVLAAQKLNAANAFTNVPNLQGDRAGTIAQLAIWKTFSGTSNNPKDQITKDHVRNDILGHAHVDPKRLSKEEQAAVNSRVDAIFDAIDLTAKESENITPPTEEQPKDETADQPSDEPNDGNQPGSPDTPTANNPQTPRTPTDGPGGSPTDGTVDDGMTLVPAFTVFHCDDAGYQDMMTVKDAYVPCP